MSDKSGKKTVGFEVGTHLQKTVCKALCMILRVGDKVYLSGTDKNSIDVVVGDGEAAGHRSASRHFSSGFSPHMLEEKTT